MNWYDKDPARQEVDPDFSGSIDRIIADYAGRGDGL